MNSVIKTVLFSVGAICAATLASLQFQGMQSFSGSTSDKLSSAIMLGCMLLLTVVLVRLSVIWLLFNIANSTTAAVVLRHSALVALKALSPKLASQVSSLVLISAISVGSVSPALAQASEPNFDQTLLSTLITERNQKSEIKIPTAPSHTISGQLEQQSTLTGFGLTPLPSPSPVSAKVFNVELAGPEESTTVVEVKTGNTIWQLLTEKHGTSDPQFLLESMQQVKELNPEITDLNLIFPGQLIRIP